MKNILFIAVVAILVSCSSDRYNVQLKNGSIVEAVNNLNTFEYKKGDTVCIYFSNYSEQWEFDEKMQDTMWVGQSYKIWDARKNDSVFLPSNIYEYRIGTIK